MITIATELRKKYPTNFRLVVGFWLPGQMVGKQFGYARVFYPLKDNVASAKEKDNEGVLIQFDQTGLDENTASQLRAIKPANPEFKTILGKFIDDISKSITIVYTDKREKAGQVFIAEYYLDNPGKPDIISPAIKTKNGKTIWVYDKEGNYLVLQDSLLCHYPYDSEETDKMTKSESW